jgi:pSer/pThr/pTyr-binding forkhead associated (FHA) protein
MSDSKPDTTIVDPNLAPRRLKESLVPPETGIFLRIEEGPGEQRVFTLSSGGVYLIGREGADVVLHDDKVSRKHAEIGLYGPEAYIVRDLASTNGTFLNGKRVGDRARMKHWDVIRVGDTLISFAVVENWIPA